MWLDEYERRARLVPGLLLVAPVAVAIVMFGLERNPVAAAIVGSLATFGAPVVLANFVRHRGLDVQDALYDSWGGKPTNQLLQKGTIGRRDRWRSAVEAVSSQELPGPDQPDQDARCDAAVAVVISKTRDGDQFRLLFNENRNYGYERNLYGMRQLGRAVAIACLVLSGAAVVLLISALDQPARIEWFIGLAALFGLLTLWVFLPSQERTRRIGFKYAEQLLDAAVELSSATPMKRTRS